MPYQGEYANKASHYDLVNNKEIQDFLGGCDYLKTPSEEEAKKITSKYIAPPDFESEVLPTSIFALDGSFYESSIQDRLPSTRVGYVKIGCMLIDMEHYNSMRVHGGQYVDPFLFAQLQDNSFSLTFPLPSSNVFWKDKANVKDSFRAKVDALLYGINTRFNVDDPSTSLRTTLFHLASRRRGPLSTGDPACLKIHKCPNEDCDSHKKGIPLEVRDVPDPQFCPHCDGEVYPSDCLRLWEEVSDDHPNTQALSRFMLQLEHMMPVHYIRHISKTSLDPFATMAFFLDGPLAVFGNGAWLSSAILDFYHEINEKLVKSNRLPLLILSLQKSGQIVEHVDLIGRYLAPNRLIAVDDGYRRKYVRSGGEESKNFGDETYYGQDFIFKTPSGKSFVVCLVYPFPIKRLPLDGEGIPSKDREQNFIVEKARIENYPQLPRALKLISHFESDLYRNSVVPVALAHRYTAISLVPGGKVLDLLTRKAFIKS